MDSSVGLTDARAGNLRKIKFLDLVTDLLLLCCPTNEVVLHRHGNNGNEQILML